MPLRTPFYLAFVLDTLHDLPDIAHHRGALMLVADLREEVDKVVDETCKGFTSAARETRRQILSDVL